MKRRKFIKNVSFGIGGASLALGGVPISLMGKSHAGIKALAASNDTDRVLVIVQLAGGNDGLNTLVPIDQYDIYKNRRPNIAIPNSGNRSFTNLDSTLSVQDQVGIHPDFMAMKELYDRGLCSIVQLVGYENINGSHFRGRDIINMGGGYEDYFSSGWLGRYLNQVYPNYPTNFPNDNMPDPIGLTLGTHGGGAAVLGREEGIGFGIGIRSPSRFQRDVNQLVGFDPLSGVDAQGLPPTSLENTFYADEINYLLQTEATTDSYADRVAQVYNAGTNSPNVEYPTEYPLNALSIYKTNPLAGSLKTVARLLSGGSKTRVFNCGTGGFDTHAGQSEPGNPTIGRHAALLWHVGEALKAFFDDLKELGLLDRVIVLVNSEFGRRIDENSGLGTDHGRAQPWFVLGRYANPGIIGTNPDLSTSSRQLAYQHDYRFVLSAILKDWFGATDEQVTNSSLGDFIDGKLPVIASDPTAVSQFRNERFHLNNCYPNPANDFTTFSFYINTELYVALNLFDMQGRLVKKIINEKKKIGLHKVKVNLEGLKTGTYIYKFESGELKDSKKLIITR